MSAGSLRVVLGLAILVAIVHTGYKLVPMYMDYWRMQDEISIKASVAQVLKDDEIRWDLDKKAKELDLPLGPQNFLITRDEANRTMTISTQWEVEVHFLFDVYVKTYVFAPRAEASYAAGRK